MSEEFIASTEDTAQEKRRRPLGIWILMILHLIGGVIGLLILPLMLLLMPDGYSRLASTSEMVGAPPIVAIISILGLFLLGLLSGIGMILGRPWGWHLTAFYYIYSIMRYSNVLLVMQDTLPQEEMSSASAEKLATRYTGRIIIYFLIYLYLNNRDVRSYFGLGDRKRWKSLLSHIAICALLYVTTSLSMTTPDFSKPPESPTTQEATL